ncbi:MAG: AAA family ATPase [Bacteroidota bacterium]
MKKLPIGIQNLSEILEEAYVYIDKTGFAHQLIENGKHYFLSRPRRFGKSLFLDTLAEIFKGHQALFTNCAIYHTDYAWIPYPVVAMSLYSIPCRTPLAFAAGLIRALQRIAYAHALTVEAPTAQEGLMALISQLYAKYDQRVVVLIDEYDKPIVTNLDNPAVADANQELLREFFGTLKDLDSYLKFTFTTGVSKFSQVSLFTGPNNMEDITLDPTYATLLGYTEAELTHTLGEHIQALAQHRGMGIPDVLAELRAWYNGYRFSEKAVHVYNPFSTLKYMKAQKPQSYWYATGTPAFLIHKIQQCPTTTTALAGSSVSESALRDVSSIQDIDLPTLMFQTGYLTIQASTWDLELEEMVYRLDFPNKEVHKAFFQSLIRDLGQLMPQEITRAAAQLRKDLTDLHLGAFVATINIYLAKIPYTSVPKPKEGFYQAILLLCPELSGLKTQGEVHTNLGRIDLVVQQPRRTFIFELKVDKPASVALDQIQTKRYQERYLQEGKEIVAVAISFSSTSRCIVAWAGGLYTAAGQLVKQLCN